MVLEILCWLCYWQGGKLDTTDQTRKLEVYSNNIKCIWHETQRSANESHATVIQYIDSDGEMDEDGEGFQRSVPNWLRIDSINATGFRYLVIRA